MLLAGPAARAVGLHMRVFALSGRSVRSAL